MELRRIRREKDVTQKELAEAVGVDPTIISKYERGLVTPSAEKINLIAKKLGVSIDALIGREAEDDTCIYDTDQSMFGDVNEDKYVISGNKAARMVLKKANGVCELCGQKFPKEKHFLETHFIKWRSKGGLPTPDNIVALCPNCHKRIHMFPDPSDIEKMRSAAKRH